MEMLGKQRRNKDLRIWHWKGGEAEQRSWVTYLRWRSSKMEMNTRQERCASNLRRTARHSTIKKRRTNVASMDSQPGEDGRSMEGFRMNRG